MTNITYHIGRCCSISIEGHACAERTPAGSDLCCAAESALACTLVETVMKLPLAGRYIYVTEGCVRISFSPWCLAGIIGISAMRTVLNGFKLLALQYPDNVSLKKQRRHVRK